MSLLLLASAVRAKAAAKRAKRQAKAERIAAQQSGRTSDGKSLWVVTKAVSLNALLSKLQRELNAAVRLRDGAVCVSCRKAPLGSSDWNGGHLFGVGAFPALRLHPLNIASQCVGCNHHKKGNHAAYAAEFIRRRGLDAFQALDAIKSEPRQWRVPDLLELRAALAQGLDAYQQRYFSLTGWTVERKEHD